MRRPAIGLLASALLLSGLSDATAQRRNRNAQDTPHAAETPKQDTPKKPEKTYASVIKDLKEDEGLFKVYQNDSKIMFEIPKSELKKDMLWITRLVSSPENLSPFLGSGWKLNEQVVQWEEIKGQIYLKSISYNNVAD